MKTKRSNRLIALVLAVMMIMPMISVPATAWSVDAEQKYYEEDFNSGIVMAENGETIAVKDDKANKDSTVISAHKYSKLLERASEDMYLLVPYKGISEGLRLKKDENGNQVYEDKKNQYGQKIKYPVMVPFLDAEGNEVKDAEGNTVMVQATEIAMEEKKQERLDENGNPIKDIAGNILYDTVLDENGKPVMVPKTEVAYKYELDEYGRPIREIPYNEPYNSSGSYGAFVYARDEEGNRIYDTVPKLDEEGNPVLNANGDPIMIPETRPVVNFVTAYEQTEAYEKYSEGNGSQILKLENYSVASSDKGIFLQMDIKIHYNNDLAIDPTLVGYDFGEMAAEPTANIMFAKVNHSKVGTSTSTSNILMATLNLKTGVISNNGDKVPGATNLRQDTWYTIKFEIDLLSGTYNTYTYNHETDVEEQYALFGNISPDNSSKGLANIAIDNAQLQIKLNEAAGAYDNRADIPYEEMTNLCVDNVAMYRNEDYVEPEEIFEPEIMNKIAGETFNTRAIGMSPKAFGYKATPDTARIVVDPEDPTGADRAVRVDFRGYIGANPDGYYIWATTNSNGDQIKDVVIKTDEFGNKLLTGKTNNYGSVSGYIWGDDQIEREYRVNAVKNPLFGDDHPDEPQYKVEYNIEEAKVAGKPSGLAAEAKLYIVTSEWYDAMMGGSNIARSFSPGNPVLRASDYNKVALQVKYWISADAVGNIEMQMNTDSANGSNGWIDTIRVDAKRNADGTPGDVVVSYGLNYTLVAGHSKIVERETWFTVNIVFNLENHWEDIFLDGEYLYTTAPKNAISNIPVKSDTWSIGKPIRNNVPADLAGYYLVDDVMIFNDKGIVDDIYNRAFQQNFDEITADTDLSTTNFATDMPSSVVFYDDTEKGHSTTLKLDMGLDLQMDDSTKIFWSKTAGAPAVYETGKYKFIHKNGKDTLALNNKNATGVFDGGVEFVGEAGVSEIWNLTKGGVTYVYEETTYAEYAAFHCLGENVNKNWIFAQPGFGSATNDLIAADFELYVPEENYGIVQSRLKEYNNGKKVYKEGIALYSIDTAAGTIGVGESTEGATLNVGEWNNISAVINIKTGEVSIFVNNKWAVDGQLYSTDKDAEGNALPETNISFMNDNWVPAMVRALPGEGDKLNGYVLIDDVRMFSVTDELIVIDGTRENFISATYNGEAVVEGDKFFITDDVTGYDEESFDVSEYEDLLDADNMKDYEIAFRGVSPAGLRFTTEVDEDILAELIEEYGEENVKMGTIILPANMVSGWETIKKADLDAANKGYINIEFQDYYEDNIMAASVTNIVTKNYTRDFRAMAYVEITLTEMGNTATICSDLMTANIAKLAHTYLDENDDLKGPIAELVEEYASFYRG